MAYFFGFLDGFALFVGVDAADAQPGNRPARYGAGHVAPLPACLLPLWCVVVDIVSE